MKLLLRRIKNPNISGIYNNGGKAVEYNEK